MRERIWKALQEVEEKEKVHVLYAVESGSRAWGFASPDSDYDVRFVYLRSPEDYLRLRPVRDVIEWQLDEVLDVSGWDLQKALRLAYNGNPALFEWMKSPVVYQTGEQWEKMAPVLEEYFSAQAGFWHYWSMASNHWKKYFQQEQVRLKKYFYVLRPLLACRWVVNRQTPPPVLFEDLMAAELEEELRPGVEKLIEQKKLAAEGEKQTHVQWLDEFLLREMSRLSEQGKDLPGSQESRAEPLDQLFFQALRELWPEHPLICGR